MPRTFDSYHTGFQQQLDDFDPNAPTRTPWATFVPRRSPQFKLHNSRGPALSALRSNEYGILYKWNEQAGKWGEVARADRRLEPDPAVCENCLAPDPDPTNNRQWYHFLRSTWVNKRGPGDPVLKFLCGTCSRAAR